MTDEKEQTPHPYAVKILNEDENTLTVGGWGVVFGGKDLDGDTFMPDTDYGLGNIKTPWVLYDHGMNDIKGAIGQVLEITPKQTESIAGLWVQAQLDKSKAYIEEIKELMRMGVLGFSSGAIPQLVRRENVDNNRVIKQWHIVEFSLTPTPAEPRTLGVQTIREMAAIDKSYAKFLPQDAGEASEQEEAEEVKTDNIQILNNNSDGVLKMTDEKEVKETPEEPKDAQDGNVIAPEMKAMQDQLTQIMEYMDSAPALKNTLF